MFRFLTECVEENYDQALRPSTTTDRSVSCSIKIAQTL